MKRFEEKSCRKSCFLRCKWQPRFISYSSVATAEGYEQVQDCSRSCCFGSDVEQENPWTTELIKHLMMFLKTTGADPSSPVVKGRHLYSY